MGRMKAQGSMRSPRCQYKFLFYFIKQKKNWFNFKWSRKYIYGNYLWNFLLYVYIYFLFLVLSYKYIKLNPNIIMFKRKKKRGLISLIIQLVLINILINF